MPSPRKLGRPAGVAIAACGLAAMAVLAWVVSDRVGLDATSQRSTMPPDTVELCGYGPTKPVRNTGDYPPTVLDKAEQTFSHVAADLVSQAAPQTRAVGLYARLVVAMRLAARSDQQPSADCTDAECMQRRWKIAKEAAAPHAVELARLATASQDPVAYAFALFGCRLNREDGACAQLSIERWAQLESDNAVPWLHLAGDAAGRKDEAALSAALLKASRAKTSDSHGSLTLQMAEHPVARALAAAPRLVYLSQLLGVYAALPTPPHLAVSQACSVESLADPDRKKLCGDLATMMTERSASLLELSLGTTIGERAGWPVERVRRLRDERDAIYFIGQVGWVAEDVHSCRFLEQLEVRTKDLSTMGEVPSARQKLVASDRPMSELAQDWRKLQSQREGASNKGADRK
jgi:hypothetical protein